MKRFTLVLLAIVLCVFCFACAAKTETTDKHSDEDIVQSGDGVVQKDPYESIGDPVSTPAFVFLVTVAGVISIAATGVLIRDARRKDQ